MREDSYDYGNDYTGLPLCLRAHRLCQEQGCRQDRILCLGYEVFPYLHAAGFPLCRRLDALTAIYHWRGLSRGTRCCSHRYGSRDYDGHLLQPLVLVQAHRQDHLRRMVLVGRLCRALPCEYPLHPEVQLLGLRLGWRCRLRYGDGAELHCRAEEEPYPLPLERLRFLRWHDDSLHGIYVCQRSLPARVGSIAMQYRMDSGFRGLYRQARPAPQQPPRYREKTNNTL